MRTRQRKVVNWIMIGLMTCSAILAIGMMFLVVGYIAIHGIGSINATFFTASAKGLGQPGGGIKHALVGSLLIVGMATLMAVPLGIAAGVFAAEYSGPRVRLLMRFLADTLVGVPSIVIGVFIYALIVVHTGFSAISGSIALAVIMLPIIARTSEEAFYLVPGDQREAALALGSPKWRVVSQVVVPAAAPGIVTGCLLATARASGETAPLLFTALGNNFYSTDVNGAMSAMPLIIYRYSLTPYAVLHDQAWATAFILVVVMLVVSAVTRFVVSRSIR